MERWRTFFFEFSDVHDFDRFLDRIEDSGYMPVFWRESWRNVIRSGQWQTVVEVLVTARKKDS
jgi:hypothetical protein